MISSEDKLVREKLISRGANSLTDIELLSLLVDDKTSALTLAEGVLEKFNGNLSVLSTQNLQTLRLCESLGMSNAARLVASVELGRRISMATAPGVQIINSNKDIYDLFRPLLSHLTHEEFWVVYLNAQNGIIEKSKISQGGVTSMVVDHKLIIKRAVELLASGLIVVHNHPSGNLEPSKEDVIMTEKLVLGASLFEINVLDHIIITPNSNVSFKKNGIF